MMRRTISEARSANAGAEGRVDCADKVRTKEPKGEVKLNSRLTV